MVSIIATIVVLASTTLLVLLLIKGWRSNTMRGFILIYVLLFNMAFVWACQIPLVWIGRATDKQPCVWNPDFTCFVYIYAEGRLISMLNLVPLSIFCFSYKYYMTVRDLIAQDDRHKRYLVIFNWLSYFSILLLLIQMVLYEIFIIRLKWFELVTEFTIEFFSCFYLGYTLIKVKLFCGAL